MSCYIAHSLVQTSNHNTAAICSVVKHDELSLTTETTINYKPNCKTAVEYGRINEY